MKIASFNINGVKARLPRLLEWLEETRPTVACLQEVKSQDEGFPAAEFEKIGYQAIWHGQKGFNGVAILADGVQPGPKFDYKLAWMERLRARMAELWALEIPCAVVGDFNVIPDDKDVWSPAAMASDALMQPASRAAYRRLLADGWTDAIDTLNPRGGVWTFWDYQAGAWQRDHGFRIDHLLLSPELADRMVAAGVDKAHRGREKASDHAPVWVEVRD